MGVAVAKLFSRKGKRPVFAPGKREAQMRNASARKGGGIKAALFSTKPRVRKSPSFGRL